MNTSMMAGIGIGIASALALSAAASGSLFTPEPHLCRGDRQQADHRDHQDPEAGVQQRHCDPPQAGTG